MNIALWIIIILSFLYIGICCWKLKIWFPISISSLVKAFKWEGIWILYIWTIAMCLAHEYFIILPDNFKFIGWLTSGFLLAVGAMPLMVNCKEIDSVSYKIHCIIGSIGCILTQVCTAVIGFEFLLPWIIFPVFCAIDYFRKDKLTMVTELFCGVTSVCSLASIWPLI